MSTFDNVFTFTWETQIERDRRISGGLAGFGYGDMVYQMGAHDKTKKTNEINPTVKQSSIGIH